MEKDKIKGKIYIYIYIRKKGKRKNRKQIKCNNMTCFIFYIPKISLINTQKK